VFVHNLPLKISKKSKKYLSLFCILVYLQSKKLSNLIPKLTNLGVQGNFYLQKNI